MNRLPKTYHALLTFVIAAPWLVNAADPPSPIVAGWISVGLASSVVLLVRALYGVSGSEDVETATLWAWLLAGCANVSIGLTQYFGLSTFGEPWVFEPSHAGVAFGNLRQPNQLATLTAMALGAVLFQHSRERNEWIKRVLSAIGMLLAFGVATTASRTGFVTWVFVVAIWQALAWRDSHHRSTARLALRLLVASICIDVFLLLWGQASRSLLHRLILSDVDCSSRILLWKNVIELISIKPLTGWGWGELDYAHFITLYRGDRFCQILDNAHNLPLQLVVELGLPIGALVIASIGGAVIYCYLNRDKVSSKLAYWTTLGSIGIHSLFEYPLWYGPFMMAAVLCFVALWPRVEPSQLRSCEMPDWRRVAFGVMAIAMLGFSAGVAWDYRRASQPYRPVEMRTVSSFGKDANQPEATWLFGDQVRFARLTTTTLTHDNATAMVSLARSVLHYSPEPRVIEILIEGLLLTGQFQEADFFERRYEVAFPSEFHRWKTRTG